MKGLPQSESDLVRIRGHRRSSFRQTPPVHNISMIQYDIWDHNHVPLDLRRWSARWDHLGI